MKLKTLIALFFVCFYTGAQPITGAWRTTAGGQETLLIFAAQHYSLAVYNREARKFLSTEGGTWRAEEKQLVLKSEYNTAGAKTGHAALWKFHLGKGTLTLDDGAGNLQEFQLIDAGTPGALAGAWLITGRTTEKGVQTITPGARKTMKILSGTRFQWIAYNSETNEFFGTGGGTYATENGRYTETIEFFSRDSTRVGMQLSFLYSLPEGNWRHQGKSSKGDPIDEIWTRRERLGL